mmetsp:Transcript_7986/g.12069  ORF Transcript_7986/g.12069 Transcript_7986/m.12069 type:complete len:413 (-) Transcript_7986:72-1310(-)
MREEKRVGIPLPIHGTEVFYVVAAVTVLAAVLIRTMSLTSCVLSCALISVPLYGVIVEGIPFSLDLVLSFKGSQSWPPNVDLIREVGEGRMISDGSNLLASQDSPSGRDEKKAISHDPSIFPTDLKYEPQRVLVGWSNHKIPAGTFNDVDSKNFQLRCGPDYSRNKKKQPSAPALYDFKGADLFVANGAGACVNVAKNIDFSKLVPPGTDGWIDGAPQILVSCLQFSVEGEKWFKAKVKTYGIIFYWQINQRGISQMKQNTPAGKLWRRFCRGELDITRFKSILKVVNKEVLGLSFVLRKSLDQLDGKPFLAGLEKDCKTGRFKGDCYLELDSLTQNYNFFARKGISSFKGKLQSIKFHYGMCIEAQSDDEMPEQLLAACEVGPGVDYTSMHSEVNWRPIQKWDTSTGSPLR